jgi:arylsulfatase A-like enzyme
VAPGDQSPEFGSREREGPNEASEAASIQRFLKTVRAICVPLIVATPSRDPGSTRRSVEAVDIYPKLAELCQLPAPVNLECRSFEPLLTNATRHWKTAAFTCLSRPRERGDSKFGDLSTLGRTVFDGRWRYTQWHDNSVELYDHESDPLEHKNLAGDSEHRKQLATMQQRLHDGWKAALPQPSK